MAQAPQGHWLAPMLAPRQVALVGASPRQGSIGHAMVEVLTQGGFAGEVWPVNPRHREVGGLACLPDLASLPAAPDLAVLSVASARMEQALTDAVAAGARSAVVFDPCMLEEDGEPRLLDRLKAIAREAGIPVCGGNGMGFYNYDTRTFASFQAPLTPAPGHIALFCHSGSVFVLLANCDARYRFNLVTSPGQEINGSVADYMDYALEQPSTRVLALFVEAVRDPAGFVAALAKAQARGVPVVVAKVGRTEASARLARSHSGALAGSDQAFQAVCERYGALRVDDIDQLMAAAQLLALPARPGPGGLAAVLDSGGLRGQLIDLAEAAGVALARPSEATVARLRSVLPAGLEPVNPLDAAGPIKEGFAEVFEAGLDTLAADDDSALLVLEMQADDRFSYMPGLIDKAKAMPGQTAKPFAVLTSFATVPNHRMGAELAEAGVPLVNGVAPLLAAVRAAFAFRDRQERPAEPVAEPDPGLAARWRMRLAEGSRPDEVEALQLAAAFGLEVVAARVCNGADAMLEAAGEIGYPVALKSARPGLDHKSDADGVRLGLADEAALRRAYDEMKARLGPRVTVAAMAPAGVELGFGMVRDPQFGPVVMVGAGGLLVELLDDRVFALPPFGPAEARRLIGRLRLARLLAGARGRPPADLEAAARALSRFSVMAALLGRGAVAEIDLNPVICGPAGAVAVDALVVPG